MPDKMLKRKFLFDIMEDNNKSSKITIGDCAEFSDTRKNKIEYTRL